MAFNSVTVQAIVTLIDNLNDLYAEQEIRLTGPAAFSLSSGGDVAEVECGGSRAAHALVNAAKRFEHGEPR